VKGDRASLNPEESHHLTKVLRLQVGDPIELFDGAGTLYDAEILNLGKRVEVTLLSAQHHDRNKEGSIVLCQGELKGGKIDFLVEKCTELGVDRLIPFSGGRSQSRRDIELVKRRWNRRKSIVKTACKQCGRLHLMQVDQEVSFEELLDRDFAAPPQKILFLEKADAPTLAEVIDPIRHSSIWLMVGPEGGFSEYEAKQAQLAGWQAVSLGNLVLRAETATISAVAIANHLLGKM
jgi:16S rRNA (uracil1498-N3)-methyltransferase